MEQNELLDPIGIALFCANAVVLQANRITNTIKQLSFLSHIVLPDRPNSQHTIFMVH